MTIVSGMTQAPISHADLISGMNIFYRTLLDLDYLREEEVQFAPHADDGKTPVATTAIHSANLTPDVEEVLQFLPYITEAGAELTEGESAITLHSQPVSYLYKGSDVFDSGERFFGYADGDEVLLPPWAILLFSGIRRDQHVVIYDTRSKKMADLTVYEPTIEELEAASTAVDELLGKWIRNLQTFDWIPWRDDDRFLGMELPPSSEQESWLADPEKRRLELVESLPQDIAEKTFDMNINGAKEDNNRYWAKRFVYEEAGWPTALDKQRLRERVRELEQALWDAWENADGADAEWESQNTVYRQFAGSRGA